MSIEKFNPRIYGESIPYTLVSTKVIQEIKNIEAGFVWVYLLTLPPDWKVVKEHLRNHFNIGQDKIKNIFSYLREHNLIEYVRERTENGRLGQVDIRVLNGSRFVADTTGVKNTHVDDSFMDENVIHSKNSIESMDITTGVKNHPVDIHTCGKPTTTKNIKNKENINNKRKDKRGKNRLSPRTKIDPSFKPNDKHLLLAAQLSLDVHREANKFIDYYEAHGKIMSNWSAAFNNWLRKASEFEKKMTKEHPVTEAIRELKEKSSDFRDFLLS